MSNTGCVSKVTSSISDKKNPLIKCLSDLQEGESVENIGVGTLINAMR